MCYKTSFEKTLISLKTAYIEAVYKGTIWGRIFRQIETKRQCYADYIRYDSNVAPHKCEWLFSLCSGHYCFVWYYRSFKMYWVFYIFNLNHSIVHLWRMSAVKHAQLLANQSIGCSLRSLQSSTLIQTERSDEGGQNRTENNLLLNYVVFRSSANLPLSVAKPTRKWLKLQFIDWPLEAGSKRESIP